MGWGVSFVISPLGPPFPLKYGTQPWIQGHSTLKNLPMFVWFWPSDSSFLLQYNSLHWFIYFVQVFTKKLGTRAKAKSQTDSLRIEI